MMLCPCQSTLSYENCCAPFHNGFRLPETAEQLMRSRYCAYVLHKIDYIIQTTVPAQQGLLNRISIDQWSKDTQWQGLIVHQHLPQITPRHSQVLFTALFFENGKTQQHTELSTFVKMGETWFFIDPTVALPSMKVLCFCGSGKKFKGCCGQFFK